jgi:anti-sigma factor RsiW
MANIVKIEVWVPDQAALAKVLSAAQLSLECGSPKRAADGSHIVTLYGTDSAAAKVAALGYRHTIDKQFGETLKKRQAQVSKTDRFKGGKVKPEGLGEKR